MEKSPSEDCIKSSEIETNNGADKKPHTEDEKSSEKLDGRNLGFVSGYPEILGCLISFIILKLFNIL